MTQQFRQHFEENTKSETDNLPRTDKVGGSGGMPFTTVSAQHQPVLGFYWKTADWGGGVTIAELTPIYAANKNPQGEELVLAKKGYAVGGLIVGADQFVRGVQIIFMRLDGDRLNPDDKYVSDWVGTQSSSMPTTLAGNGKKVLGIFGQKGAVLDSIGLILGEN